jgi:hypothetical protein
MTLRLTRLDHTLRVANPDGTPTHQFQRLQQKDKESIEAAFADLTTQLAAITASFRETARINSYPDPSTVLSGSDEAVGASITIAAHTRVYPVQGSIDVPDLVIPAPVTLTVEANGTTGIANAVQYSVYYDDTALTDTTPAYKAVQTATNHADAQAGAAAGRHFVGVITTPANGAGGTTGTGGGPPGGGGGIPLE